MSESDGPKSVLYCGVCTLPIEYCLFTAKPEKCKAWLCENHSDLFATCYPSEVSLLEATKVTKLTESVGDMTLNEDHADAEAKKHQSRGGKGMLKDDAKKIEKDEQKRKKSKVIIKMVERNKRKSVTHIRGLEVFGLDLKSVAKVCASKYACGCSVVRNPAGFDEVVIQGDFVHDLVDFIPDHYPIVTANQIEVHEK